MMNKTFSVFCFFILLITSQLFGQNYIYIKYKDVVPQDEIKLNTNNLKSAISAKSTAPIIGEVINNLAERFNISDNRLSRIYKIRIGNNNSKNEILSILNSSNEIEYIEESKEYKIDYIPNDSLITEQWGLEKVQAFEAFDLLDPNAEDVLIGVIDTGIDYNHPDLVNNMYINPGEDGTDSQGNDKRSNGIDDDGNGFIDDFRGWDFTDRNGFPVDPGGGDFLEWDNDPEDEHGHGTYVAGIIGAEANNSKGIAGIIPNVKILNLRAFDPSGYGEEDDVASAILYAVNRGVKVLNMSFGDKSFSYILKDVIQFAHSQGVTLVGSSGNSGSSLPHYPSGYKEVISVGASIQSDLIAGFSNYGSTIDLVAPGLNIVTTNKDASYTQINGTSASTPFVTGTAGLLLSRNQALTNEEVKQIVKTTSDDILEPGWDLKSGAGRLNILTALQTSAPSKVAFISPDQDFATSENEISISATILSAYFKNYQLFIGPGLNPTNWTTLISEGLNQVSSNEIYKLNTTSYSDTVYALRLVVNQNNGRTIEERINIHIDRTAPEVQLLAIGPAFFGDNNTVFSSVVTNENCIAKLFFRVKGETNFNFVSLDGFATNNFFVKQQHYGFIPKNISDANTTYEIYFEVENLVGLKTILKPNPDSFFEVKTDNHFVLNSNTKLPFTLEPGRLYKDPVNISTPVMTEVLINRFSNGAYRPFIHRLFNESFIDIDSSLGNRIPKAVGDFNNNGKLDILSLFSTNGFIDEQLQFGSSSFSTVYADTTTNKFWPILAADIDGDMLTEIISVANNDTSLIIWEVDNSFNLTEEKVLKNTSPKSSQIFGPANSFGAPNAVVEDLNNDGKKEIYTLDRDGDLLIFNIDGVDSYSYNSSLRTLFSGQGNLITAGDYTGDGQKEIAIVVESVVQLDIAPFYLMNILKPNVQNELEVIYQRAFIDPARDILSSVNQSPERALRFADLDGDNKDELVFLAFPYSFIFSYASNKTDVIYFSENLKFSSNQMFEAVFVGDLNENGVKEIALPGKDKIEFYEFGVQKKPSTPNNLAGYNISGSEIYLSWNSSGTMNYIYKGESESAITLFDSTTHKSFTDSNIDLNKFYYYQIQTKDLTQEEPLSNLSGMLNVWSHLPAKALAASAINSKSILLTFSDQVNKTIDQINAFEVKNVGYPKSVTANSQSAYTLNFANSLEDGTYELQLSNLKDKYGSPIKNDTLNFTVTNSQSNSELFVSDYKIIDNYTLQINYNIPVEQSSSTNKGNYTFSPNNEVESISYANSKPNSILIKAKNPIAAVGVNYSLQIENVFSVDKSVLINQGAGSYIVIASFKENLNDIYVYPNPVKISLLEQNITFANLPQFAEIIIFTMEGKVLKTLNESDGNGGLTWDLMTDKNITLSSGVYLYKIIQKDSNGNEVSDKIEKFAVVK